MGVLLGIEEWWMASSEKKMTGSQGVRVEAVTVDMQRPRFNPKVTAELALCGVPTGESISRADCSAPSAGFAAGSGTNALRESNRIGDASLQEQAGLGRRRVVTRVLGLGGCALVTGLMLVLMKLS